MDAISEKAKLIKLVIFDVDGVLTQGILTYSDNGIEVKNFHVHDGQGIKLLKNSGVNVGVITTCRSAIVKKRMQDLGIDHLYQGQVDKLPAYEDLKNKLKLSDTEIAYVGDDLPDLPMLKRVGLAITVPNAHPIIQQHTHWMTKAKGGKGAAREVCDMIMKAQGTYETMLDAYLKR